jgi:hypothetical protein
VPESTIRTEIYNIVSAVTNVGKVFDYERWAAEWTTFINFFKTTIGNVDQIRGWEIGRRAAPENVVTLGRNLRDHIFVIRGYMAVNDEAATEKTFNTLIEAISDAFRGNLELNDTAESHDFLQAEIIEHRRFGGVLCHYAELVLTAHELVNL